jgi:transcriptional/translational regulatory protein YebC/TACO1
MDLGIDDVSDEEGEMVIYTDQKELAKVRDQIKDQGLEILEAELTYVPDVTVDIEDKETAGKIIRLMDALEDIDDVTNTYTNFDIPEELVD